MLDTIRLWIGATRRERELRALADDLHHECDRWAERVEADRWAHKAAMAALRKQLEAVIVERDAARAERDSIHGTRDALRDECRRSARYCIQELASRHDAIMRQIEVQMDNWSCIASEMLTHVFRVEKASDIEPRDKSQDDRPATDIAPEAAGETPG